MNNGTVTPNKFSGWRNLWAIVLFFAAAAIASNAQNFTTLANFNNSQDGGLPIGSLAEGFDGNFYGMTSLGGASGYGTVYRVTPAGEITDIYDFCTQIGCPDSESPEGGLALGSDGNFYGTTLGFGCCGNFGTVFKLTPNGQFATLHTFQGPDGRSPQSGLIQATDGNFYGTTSQGGTNSACAFGCGTVFRITPGGTLTTVYSFCPQFPCTDGHNPQANLLQGRDGNLYGSTSQGGTNDIGTLFTITRDGKFTTLHSFDDTDGNDPSTALVQASNKNYGYGATTYGGSHSNGTLFTSTTSGEVTTLYSFCSQTNCADGAQPSGLIQAAQGNFYGTTSGGGNYVGQTCAAGCGTLFGMTSTGTLRTLHVFCTLQDCADGAIPGAGLVQGTDGNIYGTTALGGGAIGYGTVFRLSVGLAPFVRTSPTAGSVGENIVIFGSNLTGTTAVSFNGTPATFTQVSNTQISATVPTGSTTGMVSVTTANATLKSNLPFQIR